MSTETNPVYDAPLDAQEPPQAVPRKMLLVDDTVDKRDAMHRALHAAGYWVWIADDGDQALQWLGEVPEMHIMLMDLSLPDMDQGLELIRTARGMDAGLKIIVYTGQEVDHGMAAVQAGANFFIEHRSIEELLGVVNAVATTCEIEEQLHRREKELHLHQLRGKELQQIFDAVGVELLVRDRTGEITMVNQRKREGWRERGLAEPGRDFVGLHDSPDGEWENPPDPAVERERHIGNHTLLIKNKPIINDREEVIGWVEATWDITRRTRLVEFIQRLEQNASQLTKKEIARRIVDFLAEFTGGRVRFYLRTGTDYRGYACAKMPPNFNVTRVRLEEEDEERENAFQDHSVKTGKVNIHARCHVPLDLEGATHKLFIPLFRQLPDDRLGFIVIDNKLDPEQKFTQADTGLLSLFRSFIEVVMKGASVREEEAQEKAWLTALNSIEEELALTDDVTTVYSKVLTLMQEKTSARSALLKRVEANGSLVLLESRGLPVPMDDTPFIPPTGSIARRCIESGEMETVAGGIGEDPGMRAYLRHAGTVLAKYHQDTKAVVMLPLKSSGKVTAVCVLHFAEERALTATDQEYGGKLLRFVAQAMARMKENERIRQDAVKLVTAADAGLAAASLAHSMGNDIQKSLLTAQALQKMVAGDSDLGRKVARINHNLVGMSKRLESVREWLINSKKTDGEVLLRKDVLEPLLEITQAQMAHHFVVPTIHCPPEDRPLSKGGTKLRLALLDFVQNAMRVMPHGGLLKVGFEAKGERVTIFVADTGPGWPEAVRAALDSDNLDDTDAPIGLGLHLARVMIGSIGGRLRTAVSRIDGKGAEIRVELNLHSEQP